MRLVIPVSHSDSHLIPPFVSALVAMGSLQNHHILIVPTPSQEEKAKEMAEELGVICDNIRVIALQNEPMGQWPSASNNHFAETVHIVKEQPEDVPWLWLELDSFPTCVGWADKLSLAKEQAGSRVKYFGHVLPVLMINNETKVTFSPPGDDFMLGVAIYDHNMGREPRMNIELNDLMYGAVIPDGFDHHLRIEIKRAGRAHTELIADQWNTQNYRIEGINLVCDAIDNGRSPRKRGGIVNPQAVLVHGCKDASGHKLAALGSIVMQEPKPKEIVKSLREQVNVPRGTPDTVDPLIALLGQLVTGQAKTDATLSKLAEAIAENKAPKLNKLSGPDDGAPLGEPVGSIGESGAIGPCGGDKGPANPDFIFAIKALLADKPQTVKNLALETNLTQKEVEAIVNDPANGFNPPSGPAKWVSLAKSDS